MLAISQRDTLLKHTKVEQVGRRLKANLLVDDQAVTIIICSKH